MKQIKVSVKMNFIWGYSDNLDNSVMITTWGGGEVGVIFFHHGYNRRKNKNFILTFVFNALVKDNFTCRICKHFLFHVLYIFYGIVLREDEKITLRA